MTQEEMQDNINNINSTLEVIQANIKNVEEQLRYEKTRINKASGHVYTIEEVHGKEIDLLFDITRNLIKKVDSMRFYVNPHEERLKEHDIRIHLLESKIRNS